MEETKYYSKQTKELIELKKKKTKNLFKIILWTNLPILIIFFCSIIINGSYIKHEAGYDVTLNNFYIFLVFFAIMIVVTAIELIIFYQKKQV